MIHLEIGVRVKWADGEGDWGRDRSMGVTPVTLARAKGREGPLTSWVLLARLPVGTVHVHHPDTSGLASE